MHVLISIDDQKHGNPSVKSLSHPVVVGDNAPKTPAVELGEFLMMAAKIWLETQHMDVSQSHQFVQSLVKPAAKHH
jgi:hypothetical protein